MVRAVDDLFDRFDMGTLDRSSFVGTQGSWSARYIGPEAGSGTELELRDDMLTYRSQWRGLPTLSGGASGNSPWAAMGMMCATSDQAPLFEHIRAAYNTRNVQVVVPPKTIPNTYFMPDGVPVVVSVPIHLDRLSVVGDWFASLDWKTMQMTGEATLCLDSYTIVLSGELASLPNVREEMHETALMRVGLPLIDDISEDTSGAQLALSIPRRHYRLTVQTVFRCLSPVLQSLIDANIVHSSAPCHEFWLEDRTFVLPFTVATCVRDGWLKSRARDGAYTIHYGRFAHLSVPALDSDDPGVLSAEFTQFLAATRQRGCSAG